MSEQETNYPLCWPEGWRRTPAANRANPKFGTTKRTGAHASLTVSEACDRVLESLEAMRVPNPIISTNVQPTLSGRPRSGQGEPADPGVAVYWATKQGKRCMAIDRYNTVAGNLAAIAATLEAMRAIERHGGAEILDRAFTGFAALPARPSWHEVLGVSPQSTLGAIEAAYRDLAKTNHPDVPGGSSDRMAEINRAIEEARKEKA